MDAAHTVEVHGAAKGWAVFGGLDGKCEILIHLCRYLSGDVYEGNWQWGKQQGRGTCFFTSGDIFEGVFMNNQRQGLGILIRPAKVRHKVRAHIFTFRQL
jgi:hypothetical protein